MTKNALYIELFLGLAGALTHYVDIFLNELQLLKIFVCFNTNFSNPLYKGGSLWYNVCKQAKPTTVFCERINEFMEE